MIYNISRYIRHIQRLLVIAAVCLPILAVAQDNVDPKAKEYHERAYRSATSYDFTNAIIFANKAIEVEPAWERPYLLLADVYHSQRKYEEEKAVFERLKKNKPDALAAYLNLGTLNFDMGEYNAAVENYELLLTLPNVEEKYKTFVRERLRRANYALELMANPVPFDLRNMGPNINSTDDEYFPAFTVDMEAIYFTRRKQSADLPANNPYAFNEDLMVAKRKGASWGKAYDVPGAVNTIENEGAVSIAPDGSFMVFTGCNRKDGFGSCDLYISFFRDGDWTRPVNMQEPVNSRAKETQPSISFDGRSIYFVSDRPGTNGKLDIWITTRDDSWNFGAPVNLGDSINTNEDEQAPFIHPDDQTLYFCSAGHMGMGKNDIFYARKSVTGKWGKPTNIGYPINTFEEEPGLVVDRSGDFAYYSSHNKDNTIGGIDIYYFKLPKEAKPKTVTYLKGKVMDAYTKEPLYSYFELVDLEDGKTLVGTNTSKQGEFLVPVPGGRDYMVSVSKNGYLFYSDNIPMKDYTKSEPYHKDIYLKPIKPGEKITLKNIFFDTDSYNLKDESKSELERVISFLKANPTVKVEISGHTDNTGNPAHNKELSNNRAKTVQQYLISKGGIDAARLSFKGYGETVPIASNETAEGKAQNRRTEMTITQ